jgi:hypothetical protein
MDEENKIEQKIEDENKKEEVSSTVLKTQGITTEENVSVEDYNVSNSREVASENEATTKEEVSASNNEIKPEEANTSNETQESFFSSMIGENDFLAQNRNSEYAFDQAFAQFADDFDAGNSVLKTGFQDIENFVNGISEKLENEENRISNTAFNQEEKSEVVSSETTKEDLSSNNEKEQNVEIDKNIDSSTVNEKEVSNDVSIEQKEEISSNNDISKEEQLNQLEQKLEAVNEKISNVSNEEIIESQNKIEITQEMRDEQKISEDLSREGQKDNDTEYAYSPDKKESAEELFSQREELTNQLEKEIKNPVNGTFEIEDKLEAVNEKISNLTMDDIKEYNDSLSPEITQEMRDEQKASEDLSREGQKGNDTEYGNFEYKEEVETTLNREELSNQLEKESGFYKDSDIENINKEELVNQLEKESSSTEDKSSLNDLIQERDSLQEQINEIKNEVSNDVESSADNLKMELAKEEFTSYAEQNLPESEREEFVNTMLDISADSIKSQDTLEGVEKEINSSLESYQEVKAELEAEKNVDVSSETNLKQDVEIDKNVDLSTVNEKEVSSDLQSKDVPEAVSDKEVSKEVEAEKNVESNVNSDKEQNKQTEIDFSVETGASK